MTSRNSSACWASFAIASCAAFGCALRMRCRRSRYHSQTSFGSRANASGVASLCRIEVSPVAVLSTKGRNSAFSRNARAGQNENTHNVRSMKQRRFPSRPLQNAGVVSILNVATAVLACQTRAMNRPQKKLNPALSGKLNRRYGRCLQSWSNAIRARRPRCWSRIRTNLLFKCWSC